MANKATDLTLQMAEGRMYLGGGTLVSRSLGYSFLEGRGLGANLRTLEYPRPYPYWASAEWSIRKAEGEYRFSLGRKDGEYSDGQTRRQSWSAARDEFIRAMTDPTVIIKRHRQMK